MGFEAPKSSSKEHKRLWTLGRIDAAQAAQILGFQGHDIPILVKAGLLKPLGKPAPNARRYFAAVDVQEKAQDAVWIGKATQVLYCHWRTRNANKVKAQERSAPLVLNEPQTS